MDIDSLGVGKALTLFPEQIKESFKQGYSIDFPRMSPKAVLISGMGGSSNAGKILQGLYESDLKTPLIVFNDYGLPSWVDSETLVIANSYSGNTEETLSAVDHSQKIGAKLVCIATGGRMGEMITKGDAAGVIINPGLTNPTGFPKTGLGVSLGALAGVLAKIGILTISEKEISDAADEIVKIRESWDTKQIAAWLNGYLPVLFSGRPFIGALNSGRNAMCEISRNLTQFYDFPEVNHVLIEAMKKPDSAKNIKYIFFLSKFLHERVLRRFKITADILIKQGLSFDSYTLKGSTKLTQGLELAHYLAWVGYNLAILQGDDPGPEPWIGELKELLKH